MGNPSDSFYDFIEHGVKPVFDTIDFIDNARNLYYHNNNHQLNNRFRETP